MSQKNKAFVGWLAFLFVCIHISALFIFASPHQFGLNRGKRLVNAYVSPLFSQSWSMFAPCPIVKGKIHVKIQYDDETIDWFDPRENDRKWHGYLRGSHHGDLILLEANVLHYIWTDLDEFNLKLNEPVPDYMVEPFRETGGYVHARRYAYGVARNRSKKQPEKMWVRVEIEHLETGESGIVELPEMMWW